MPAVHPSPTLRFNRTISLLFACALAGLTLPAGCALVSIDRANADSTGLAIHGYDPVAYFTLSAATPGLAEFAMEYKGARWLFANAKHRELFAAEPAKYLPAYGGYCAYGMAWGVRVDVDPTAWEIAGGRLYLMNTAGVLNESWIPERSSNIKAADDWWASRAGE